MSRRHLVGLAIILAIAAFLRLDQLGKPSVWIDEISSIEIAMGRGTAHDSFPPGVIRFDQPDTLDLTKAAPWWDIWNHTQITTHPPLYFIALRWWIDLFGNRPVATRSFSVVCSLAGIVVLFDVCRRLHGERVALLAAAIMAVSCGQIDVAQEARGYPMLILIGLGCCDLIVRAQRSRIDWRSYTALTLLLATMLLTHYFAAAAYGALAAYVAIRFRGRQRTLMLTTFAVAAVVAVAAWARQFYLQTINIPDANPSYVREAFHHHALQTLIRAAYLPIDHLCGFNLSRSLPLWVAATVGLAVLLLLIRAARRKDQLLWILWVAAIVGSICILDLTHGSAFLYYTRYTVLASPALFALLAGVDWPRMRVLRNVAPIALIAFLTGLALLRAYRGVPPRQDFRLLAGIVESHAAPDELLIFQTDSGWVTGGLRYLGYKYYSPDSHHPWMTLAGPADAKVMATINSRRTVWLIGLEPELDGPAFLPGWRVEEFWPTTAGVVCLMQKAEH